jgi:PAS domain S-box-containing protein
MGLTPILHHDESWDANAMYFNIEARTSYERLMASIMQMAVDGADIFRYAGPFFNNTGMVTRFCTEDGRRSRIRWQSNMRTIWAYYFLQTILFKTHPNISAWFTVGTEPLCIVLSSIPSMSEPMQALTDSLLSMADDAASDSVALLTPLKWALPGGLLVFSMALFGIASFLYVREVNHFASLLLNLPKSVKRECMKPLRCDGVREETVTASGNSVLVVPHYSLPIIFNIFIGIVLAGGCCVLFAQMLNIESYNQLYTYFNGWVVDARGRKSSAMEAMVGTLFAVIDYSPMTRNAKGREWDYIDDKEMLDMAQNAISNILTVNKRLFEVGDDGKPSTVGYDEEIDSLSLKASCESNPNINNFHEDYRCSSALQLMEYHIDTLNKIIISPGRLQGRVDKSNPFGELVHLLDFHLLPTLTRIDEIFSTGGNYFARQFIGAQKMFVGLELCLMVVAAVLVIVYTRTINSCYNVLLVLLRRISPVHILACEPLEAYLLNKSTGKRRTGLTVDERIIDSSADCIICLGPTGVIDMINPAVTRAFGYTPEQLLGQLLVSLLTADQTEKIGGQMKLMAEKQSAPLFEGHTICVTDDEKEVNCSISLLAIFEGDEVSSFVAILKDESALIKQQAEAEIAKQQSETLLYQILPRDIVARLNAGEKDISFSIASVTISFIDIVKFSEYAANLTPQDIMGNLSLIFCAFDEACAKYPLLMKINLIGDVYMCAGGLFSPESPPMSHAEQMIRFGLDALQVIEDVNMKLTTLLAVRIGVNSGGPILAGVLGTDKPAFDIIGDPINIAARLQSTDVPGRIQISETTYALVASLGFQIEPRGDVELKGKGKRMTYLIDPIKEQSLVLGVSPSLEEFARLVPGEPLRPN